MNIEEPSKEDCQKVRRWMQMNEDEYVDRKTGETNLTNLAEAAASEFKIYIDDDEWTIPEWVFELSANL